MKAADLRTKTKDELEDELLSLTRESLNLRFQRASGQLEATGRVRTVRRDIARVRTVLNQKFAS
jgi:large subunit ribosomal protein L29